LFAETGISLEAHVQNSLVQLENGFPSKFYVRDLEGISLDKSQASAKGWLNSLIAETSPVLASEPETWLRLQYYFFVNHLGHLVHTLAMYSKQNELVYWQVVRSFLQHEHTKTSSERLKKFTKALLENVTLPAKANLISRFQARSETPLYVNIANPIFLCSLKN
jgi:siderophore synthetase component